MGPLQNSELIIKTGFWRSRGQLSTSTDIPAFRKVHGSIDCAIGQQKVRLNVLDKCPSFFGWFLKLKDHAVKFLHSRYGLCNDFIFASSSISTGTRVIPK